MADRSAAGGASTLAPMSGELSRYSQRTRDWRKGYFAIRGSELIMSASAPSAHTGSSTPYASTATAATAAHAQAVRLSDFVVMPLLDDNPMFKDLTPEQRERCFCLCCAARTDVFLANSAAEASMWLQAIVAACSCGGDCGTSGGRAPPGHTPEAVMTSAPAPAPTPAPVRAVTPPPPPLQVIPAMPSPPSAMRSLPPTPVSPLAVEATGAAAGSAVEASAPSTPIPTPIHASAPAPATEVGSTPAPAPETTPAEATTLSHQTTAAQAVADHWRRATRVLDTVLESSGLIRIEPGELSIGSLIGAGNSGNVFCARWSGHDVVVKQHRQLSGLDERELLTHVKAGVHQNVVQLYGVCVDHEHRVVSLVMEYVKGGNLKQHLDTHGPRTDLPGILAFGAQLADGLAHLHSKGIVHRDIAARNILLDEHGEPKVCDFGLSRSLKSPGYMTQATVISAVPFAWMPPESLSPVFAQDSEQYMIEYSPASDVYMFGCTMLELVTAQAPWQGYSRHEVMRTVGKRNRVLHDQLPGNLYLPLRRLLFDCWLFDHHDRPSMTEVRDLLLEMQLSACPPAKAVRHFSVDTEATRLYRVQSQDTVETKVEDKALAQPVLPQRRHSAPPRLNTQLVMTPAALRPAPAVVGSGYTEFRTIAVSRK